MVIITFFKLLFIIMAVTAPAAYVGEIVGNFAGSLLWERSVRKTRSYTSAGTLTR